MEGSAAFLRVWTGSRPGVLLRSLAGAVVIGAVLTGCSSGGSGGSGDGSAALRAGSLMFIGANKIFTARRRGRPSLFYLV